MWHWRTRGASGWATYINVTRPRGRRAEMVDTATLHTYRFPKDDLRKAKPIPLDDPESVAATIDRALKRHPKRTRAHARARQAIQDHVALTMRPALLDAVSGALAGIGAVVGLALTIPNPQPEAR